MSSMSLDRDCCRCSARKSYTYPESKHTFSMPQLSQAHQILLFSNVQGALLNHRTLESSSSTQHFLYIFPVFAACFENHIEHRLSRTPLCGGTTGRVSLPSQFAGFPRSNMGGSSNIVLQQHFKTVHACQTSSLSLTRSQLEQVSSLGTGPKHSICRDAAKAPSHNFYSVLSKMPILGHRPIDLGTIPPLQRSYVTPDCGKLQPQAFICFPADTVLWRLLCCRSCSAGAKEPNKLSCFSTVHLKG